MITIQQDSLVIRFPHISEDTWVSINFQRTLRIPDDGHEHQQEPPELGGFPLRRAEDYNLGASNHRKDRGGIILPMFQTDALWLQFYPEPPTGHSHFLDPPAEAIALKIGAGKINAVSGEKWSDGLTQHPRNYFVVPGQPYLYWFNVGEEVLRQFVAMPLGQSNAVDEHIDPESDVGGIQIEAVPMKKEIYDHLWSEYESRMSALNDPTVPPEIGVTQVDEFYPYPILGLKPAMGEWMKEFYADGHGLDCWEPEHRQRCFVMFANTEQWMKITGEEPPLSPISAEVFSKAGLPWFDYFDGDRQAIDSAKALGKLKSVPDVR